MKSTLLIALALLRLTSASAQLPRQHTTNQNGWYMYFGDHQFAPKWGVHLEAQFRRNHWLADPQQLLLRTGLNYYFTPQTFATIGYCFVETYPYGQFSVAAPYPEHRIWEQVQLKNQAGIFEWVSRFRLEQRFSQQPVLQDGTYIPGDAVYSNRFRLLNRFSVPFKGRTIQDGSLYATVYDEILLSFGRHVGYNLFDQNRAYIALGYKLHNLGRLEIGYMNQQVMKGDGIRVENNHTLQISLTSTIAFRSVR